MKVLLGVTGGIAAYKALELTRLFIKAAHEVQVVMTSGAKEFIQPLSFQALSGRPVRDSLFDENQEAGMGHIELARWADVIVVAPASAESLAKFRMGRADDLLTTLILATTKPILVAPAMNRVMWSNEATQENVAILKQRGWQLLNPGKGGQACGEIGEGRMPEPQDIYTASLQYYESTQAFAKSMEALKKFWQGKSVLVTAGPTFEEIDPVRYLGNRSSGKMGFAIAELAALAGACVTLIAGPVQLKQADNIQRIDVRSAHQMFVQVQQLYAHHEFFISAAAVADFRVAKPFKQKIKKQPEQADLTLSLEKNPDILAWVAQQENKPFTVGFAAETENVLAYAKDKLQRKNLDMICANQVGSDLGFDQDDNALTLITPTQTKSLQSSAKTNQARQLLEFIAEHHV